MSLIRGGTAWLLAASVVLLPVAANAQDKGEVRKQAKASAAQLRALGEPKDRCATGAELQDGNVVARVYSGSTFKPGDKLLSIAGTDVAGKSAVETIGIVRAAAPDATISAVVSREGKTLPIQIACTNSRPMMEAFVLGLEQAAAGKFDECMATFSRPLNLGVHGAVMKAQCAALAKRPDDRIVGEANFEALRFAAEDATFVPSARAGVARQLRAMEGSITKSVGAARYQELVSLTRGWVGDEQLFATSEPDWGLFRRNGEQALRGRLIDPGSARIEWPRGFLYGTWKPLLSKRIEGYWTCGSVNARNRMGGYTGATAFVVVMDNAGSPLFVDMGSGRDFDVLSTQCAKSATLLPPPPAALAGSGDPAMIPNVSLGDELKKLAELKASGALSEAEFQAAKEKLLGRKEP